MGMGSTTIKKVKDKEYLYYSYYDSNKKKVSAYCGPASDPKSKKKAIEFEIEELQSQKDGISTRIKELMKYLRK